MIGVGLCAEGIFDVLREMVFSVQDECVLMFSLKDEVCRGYVLVKCSDREL